MALLVWPPELPQCFSRHDIDYPYPEGRDRAEMDRGPTKSRGDAAGAPTIIPCSVPLRRRGLALAARLRRFWSEDTEGGNLPFVVRDQQFDGTALLDDDLEPLLDEDGVPLTISASWVVKFASPPVERYVGSRAWQATFNLERIA